MPKVNKREVKKEENLESLESKTALMPSATYFSAEFAPERYLVYSRFNGQDWIHVREYVMTGEHTYPTKK